jgi:uncharacterized membrane protein
MKQDIRFEKFSSVFTVFVILLIAIFLRLFKLGEQGLFLDEALSWLHSQFPSYELIGILGHLNHVPLYFFILKLYLIFAPQTEFALRSLSVLFSLLNLLIVILIMYRWWGIRASIFSGWLITISSLDIYYAQDVRMYTLLSFLWVVSFGLLLEIVKGRKRLFPLWGIVLILASYTHIYGLILAFVQSVFIIILWINGKYLRMKFDSSANSNPVSDWTWYWVSIKISETSKWVLGAGIFISIAVFPIIWILSHSTAWRSLGGGVWIPTPKDIPNLFLLGSVGITAVRHYFLDNNHLVLPILSTVPTWGWGLIGLLVLGSLVILGSLQSWRDGRKQRWLIGLIMLLSIGPIALIWVLGWLLQTNTWAYKSFLGPISLFYMLAGIGFSKIIATWVRWLIICITLLFSLASLIPYYSFWNKDYSRDAFLSLPNSDEGGIILMERAYMSPLAHFYLGTDQKVYALSYQIGSNTPLLYAEFGPKFMYGYDKLTCDELSTDKLNNVWFYGNTQIATNRINLLPGCFGDSQLWVFNKGKLQAFN